MAIFSFTMTIMASVYIVSDLGGSSDIALYSLSFFGLGTVLGMPLGRSLSYQYGTIKLLCICLILFSITSLLAGLSSNYIQFIVLRVLQGILSAPFYILSNHLFSGLTPRNHKHLFTMITLAIYVIVPILAACWGGVLAYNFTWRAIFFIDVLITAALSLAIKSHLGQYQPKIESYQFDGVGYLFYALGIFSIGFVIITGQFLDWYRSHIIVSMALIGAASLTFFFLWSRYHPYPLFEWRLFKQPLFAYGIINLMVLFGTYYGFIVLLSLWLNIDVRYTPEWIALLLIMMAVFGFVPPLLFVEKMRRFDPRISLFLAILCLAISSFHTTVFNQYIDFERIAVSRIIAGLGLAFFLPPVFRLCFHCFAEEKFIHVMELFQVCRNFSGLLGVALYDTLWQRRKVFYHSRYGSDLTAFSEETKQFFSDSKQFHLSGLSADAQLNDFLNKQSSAFALDDCFLLMGISLVCLLILLLVFFLSMRTLKFAQ